MFSRTTTELSIRREKASARPPSTMLLMEPPPMESAMKAASAERGIENVEDYLADQFFRDVEQVLHRLLDAVHHRDRIGISTQLEHRQVDRRVAVDPYQVGLDLLRILGITDIGNTDRRLADGFHRKIVDLPDCAQLAIGVDVVVQHAQLHVAGR